MWLGSTCSEYIPSVCSLPDFGLGAVFGGRGLPIVNTHNLFVHSKALV